MTAKVIQFPDLTARIKLTKEVLIPGKLIFDWDRPEQAVHDALTLFTKREIGKATFKWARNEILNRLVKANARLSEVQS